MTYAAAKADHATARAQVTAEQSVADPVRALSRSRSARETISPSPQLAVGKSTETAGRPLGANELAFFGTTFGHDFSQVRVHTDGHAAASVSRAGALAYTVGEHVFFAGGGPAPATRSGRRLLAHELAHVIQQRRGHGRSGLAEDAKAEADADQASRAVAEGKPFTVTEARPTGVARQPAGAVHDGQDQTSGPVAGSQRANMATVPMYEYRDESGAVVRVSEQEYGQLRRKATVQLAAAITRVQGTAEVWRNTHAEHMNEYHAESWSDLWDKPQRIIGVASDIRAGVVPPPLSMWGHPLHAAEGARKALDAGDLVEAARLLRLSEEHLKDAKHEWNTYIEASISGAGKLEGELETIRDTSFAIAVGAAVIVAAPVVAAGAGAAATGIGLSGTAATVAGTGGAALGTGLVGLGTGTVLRGGSDVAAQKIATGKVDLHRTAAEVRKHAKEDFVAGVTAGLAPGAGKLFGAGSEGLSMTQNVLRQGAAAGTATGVAHLGATGADTAYALGAEGKTWEQAKKENLLPGLEQTGRATLAAGIGGGVSALPGTAAAKLAATGRPMLGQAVQHGGGALAAAATTLVTSGSSREAVDAALNALVFSAAQPGSREPGRGGSKKSQTIEAKDAATTAAKSPGTGAQADVAPPSPAASTATQTKQTPPPADQLACPAMTEASPVEHEPGSTPHGETAPSAVEPSAVEPSAPVAAETMPAAVDEPGAAESAPQGPSAPEAKGGEPGKKAIAKPKTPRQRRNEPFSPDNRRPSLNQFRDIAPAAIDRHSGVRTNPEARVGVFKESLPERVPTPSGATRQELGHSYEASLREDLIPGGGNVRLRSSAGGKGRISDVGVHEITIEKRLSSAKLDQLWSDLIERNEIMLTVDKLNEPSAKRLAHMAAIYEKLTGKRPHITVRETSP